MKQLSKKLLSLLLATVMVLGMLPGMALAEEGLPPTTAPEEVLTELPDLTIRTVEAFKDFADAVNGGNTYEGKLVVLEANLDLVGSATNQWSPINGFLGAFDGQNHVVSGLYIDATTQNQGLFGDLPKGGTVKNLTVSGSVTTTKSSAAGIVGYNKGTIENCRNDVDVTCTGSMVYYHGGIAGWNFGGTITACVNTGAIAGMQTIGGIAGATMNTTSITSCYNTGAVSASGSQAGGIVGQARDAVQNCYNIGTITAPSDAGGIVGVKKGGSGSYNFYLTQSASNDAVGAREQTTKELEALAPTLGAPFEAVPGGYPAFAWEKDVDASDPVVPGFQEATALSKILSGNIHNAINSKKTQANPAITGSLLSQYTESSTGTDWIAITMGRYGYFADRGYQFRYDDGTGYTDYLAALKTDISAKYAKNDGLLDSKKATEWQRAILAINAIGGDPTSFGTYSGSAIDLVNDGTYNHAQPGWQGINGLIFGLIALDSKRYEVPANAVTTRAGFIEKILALQLADGANGNPLGGWALNGSVSDPDISAMAIQALTPYYTDSTKYTYTNAATDREITQTVGQAVDMALERLSNLQRPEGDFASWGVVNCESTAQVLTALCGLGIDPAADTRFIKNGITLLDGLNRYQLSNGGFTHAFVPDPANPTASAGQWNGMATDQASYALVAYWRFENGMRRLYDMRNDFTSESSADIAAAVSAIRALPIPGSDGYKAKLKAALALCREVDATERSYIGNYGALAVAIEIVGGEGALDTEEAYVTGMSVTTPPSKRVYIEDDMFDPAGMVVKLSYSDGTSEAVTDYTIIPSTALTLADTAVIIKRGLHKATVPVTVNEKSPWVGMGTVESPYLLGALADLQELAAFVNTKGRPTAGLYFKMTADIDLSSVAKWTSIGTDSKPFQGNFDGNYHSVSNLTGDNGFFGAAGDSAVIRNFGVASGLIGAGNAVDRGGVVGSCNGADLINCWNGATINVNNGGYSGGVAGAARRGTGGTISGCYNVGEIRGADAMGGIIGYINGGTYTVENCYNAGAVSGMDAIGGIVGKNQGTLTMRNCYNRGALVATHPVMSGAGALVGGPYGTTTLSDCYYLAAGALAGTGKGDNHTTAKTAEELKDPAFLATLGNAFKADFSVPANGGYPVLAWQTGSALVTFAVTPANAVVVLRSGGTIVPQGGENCYALKNGSYTYMVSLPSYNAKSGTLTVADAGQTITVALESSGGVVPPTPADDTIEATLTDGMTQHGSRRTFDVIARDKNGAKIAATCKLNGTNVPFNWDDDIKTSFTLVFKKEGANTVEIKAGKAIATYTVHYTKATPGEAIGRAAVAVEAFPIGGGYLVAPCYVDILEGENAAQMLDRLLREKGLTYTKTGTLTSGFYLSSVEGDALRALPTDFSKVPQILLTAMGHDFGAPADWHRDDANSLGQFDFTNGSGWMYCVNTAFPNVGFADYYLSDGDVARIQFTLAYGADVGGGSSAGSSTSGYYAIADKDALTALLADKGVSSAPQSVLDTAMKLNASQSEVDAAVRTLSSNADTIPGGGTEKPKEEPSIHLKPEAATDKNGAAKAEVTEKEITAAIERAKKDGATAIIIEPAVKGDAKKVSVELPRVSVAALAKDTAAKLTVKTGIAGISIPTAALAELGKESGKTVSISAEALTDKDGKATGQVKLDIKVGDKSIEILSGGVTVTLPLNKPTAGTVLMLVTNEGAKLIKKSAVNGKALSALLDGTATVEVKDNSKTFTDVPDDHWGADAVTFAAAHELFSGMGAGTFSPATPMSRAMLVTVLNRLENEAKAERTVTFADVESGTWYASAVTWAAANEIITGTGAGFNPEGSVTRESLATMLYHYAQAEKLDTTAEGGAVKTFADADSISPWAVDGMTWAVAAGLLTGKGENTLDPAGTASRAEVAAVLQRLVTWMVR